MASIKEFFRRKDHLDFKGRNVLVYPTYPLSYTSGLANVHIPLATALICSFAIAFVCISGKHLRSSFLATFNLLEIDPLCPWFFSSFCFHLLSQSH